MPKATTKKLKMLRWFKKFEQQVGLPPVDTVRRIKDTLSGRSPRRQPKGQR